MEDFAVTCPLVPNVPHLISGSCSSPRAFALSFLQTPSHDDALALLLAFGSSYTWHRDLHPTSSVPCPAHTFELTGWTPQAASPSGTKWSGVERMVRHQSLGKATRCWKRCYGLTAVQDFVFTLTTSSKYRRGTPPM